MKKAFVLIVLIALAVLCVNAASAETLEEAKAFYHQVYEANRLETLFSRHESVAYSFIHPMDTTPTGYVWETEDSIYQEWGTEDSKYERDRIVYQMICDKETGALELCGGIDCNLDYDPFYTYVRPTEEKFYDAEHDHVTEIDEQDGLLYSASLFDETLSRDYIENTLKLEYEGQTIRTEVFVDPETYEVVKDVTTMLNGEEETVVYQVFVEYDAPEPLACHTLRSAFERDCEEKMTVTFVVDPGSDHEFARSATVPANMDFAYMYGETPLVYFDDPDCEKVSSWDRMSDMTKCVFTYPDEALVEKFQALEQED